MATTDYATASAQLSDVESDITSAVNKLRRAKSSAQEAQTQLGGMPTKYSGLIQWIDDEASANPGEEAIQDLKRRKDALVASFQNRKATADGIVADLSNYDP